MIQVPSQVRFGNQGIGWRLFVGGEYRIPHRSNIAPTPNSPKNPRSTCVFLLIRVVRTTWRGLGTYVSYTSTGYWVPVATLRLCIRAYEYPCQTRIPNERCSDFPYRQSCSARSTLDSSSSCCCRQPLCHRYLPAVHVLRSTAAFVKCPSCHCLCCTYTSQVSSRDTIIILV